MWGRLCDWLAALAVERRTLLSALALGLSVLALALVTRLPRPTDFSHALPPEHPVSRARAAVLEAPVLVLRLETATESARQAEIDVVRGAGCMGSPVRSSVSRRCDR